MLDVGKKEIKKRQASSPLTNNSELLCSNLNNKSEQKKDLTKKCKQDRNSTAPESVSTTLTFECNRLYDRNMAFPQQQQAPFGMSQASYGSPPAPYNSNTFGFQPTTSPLPPPWANELLEEIKQIKSELQSIEKIEKTVNVINAKVSDLETKLKSLDVRVTENEKLCQFTAAESECNQKDLKTTKEDIKQIKKNCQNLENNTNTLSKQSAELDTKLIDLEMRSMRDNLMFYGLPEGGNTEKCEMLVKNMCSEILKIERADSMIFDRAHRVGQRATKARPIVVKFHYFSDREKVRQASFDFANQLKAANLGVGAQLPKAVRDARKPLYPAMKKPKMRGKPLNLWAKNCSLKEGSISNKCQWTSREVMESLV